MRFLTVSFDYELAWGTYEMARPQYLLDNVMHENEAAAHVFLINETLRIPAAWGMVGAAIDPSPLESRLERCAAVGAPISRLAELLDELQSDQVRSVTRIPQEFHDRLRSSSQEAAGHSYSHSYPETLSRSRLAEDFAALTTSLSARGHTQPMIYIAPKNRVTSAARELAKSSGFCYVRENPPTFLYDPSPRWSAGMGRRLIRASRYADAITRVDEITSRFGVHDRRDVAADSVAIGNFFFRANLAGSALGRRHLRRLQRFAEKRFSDDRHVHVWTHPHNFGSRIGAATDYYHAAMSMLLAVSRRYGAAIIAPSEVGRRDA